KGNIDGRGAQRLTHAADNFAGITIAVQQMMLGDPGFVNQTLEKIFAKAGRMSNGQPDVFVEVKDLDTLPVDVLGSGQCLEKIHLSVIFRIENEKYARLLGRSRLCAGKTGCETEQANAEVDQIVVYVQAQLDRTEVAKAGESCNRDKRINSPKNQAEQPRSV